MSTHSLSWSRSTLTMYKESTRDDSNFAISVNFVLIHLQLSLIICNSRTITRIRGTFKEYCQVYIHNEYWPATPLIHPYLYASSHNILYILRYQNRQKYQFTELICPWDNQIVWHSIWHGIILKQLQWLTGAMTIRCKMLSITKQLQVRFLGLLVAQVVPRASRKLNMISYCMSRRQPLCKSKV